jgi:hypothetical protein
MTTTNQTGGPVRERVVANSLTYAWLSVVLTPGFFILAFVVGEGLFSLLGYDPGIGEAPLWAVLVAAVPAVLIVLAPCVAAVVFGQIAVRAGRRSGVVPLTIAAVVGLWMLGTNVAGFFFG